MSSNKNIDRICIVVTVLALLLTALFMNGESLGLEKIVDEDAEADPIYFTANDLRADWDTSDATVVTLNGSGGRISGSGAYFYDGNLVISSGGRYVLSGTLDDGYVSVDAYSGSKVWIRLDGVTVNCSDDACLRVEQADKVFLTLAEGTENSFTSGADYTETALEDGTGGAIFSHDDLTINGSGSLTVTAGYKHGIDANDALVITGGTIRIACPQDGVHVNDGFYMCNASLTVAAGDDGIHSDASFYIESGTLLISESYEGIEAVTIDVAGGDITVYCSDDGLNANGGSGDMPGGMGGGMFGGRPDMSELGGERPEASGMPEMPASFDPAGELPDLGAGADAPSEGTDTEEDGETWVRIRGGAVTVVNENARDADGIDSNGSIYITGGSIRVSMSADGGYALDVGSESGGVMEIGGGDVVGCGSYSMAESFDPSSTQPSILYICSAGAEAGTTVALEDTEGNVLISYTAPCAFSCVNLSCPEMEVGKSYLMVIGDEVEEIALTEISASYGDAQSGGFGGTMNFGGMRSRSGFGGGRGGPEEGTGTSERPGFGGEMPDFGGERPERGDDASGFGGMQGRPDFAPPASSDETAAQTADNAGYDGQTWLWSGISAALLLAGLAFSAAYRRRGRNGALSVRDQK